MPWIHLAQLYLIMSLTGGALWALYRWVHRSGWHLPPKDPTRQFKLVQRALDAARRKAIR